MSYKNIRVGRYIWIKGWAGGSSEIMLVKMRLMLWNSRLWRRVWRKIKGGWKEGLLAIWECCGRYCFYTYPYGWTVNCLCADLSVWSILCIFSIFLLFIVWNCLKFLSLSLFLITKLSYILWASVLSSWTQCSRECLTFVLSTILQL